MGVAVEKVEDMNDLAVKSRSVRFKNSSDTVSRKSEISYSRKVQKSDVKKKNF